MIGIFHRSMFLNINTNVDNVDKEISSVILKVKSMAKGEDEIQNYMFFNNWSDYALLKAHHHQSKYHILEHKSSLH